ncbi:hypothetical protein LOAG_02137 [Loa loa]|uniref:Uncharacterized protein n=1 Tax=Loa loa TaxID=7209 RepID=A0A1S0U7B7_LOALO|nr:hypothetical protein LOAG_02137 [Loa loa]EFO26339.2 hypothetical protein LOAG_02137 [Loa loa]
MMMCTYVWRNLNEGYTQKMCGLAASSLVILDDGKILSKLRRKSVTNELNTSCSEEGKSQDYVLVPTCTPPLLLNESNDLDETTTHEISTVNDSTSKLRKRDKKRTMSESEVDELMRLVRKSVVTIGHHQFHNWIK